MAKKTNNRAGSAQALHTTGVVFKWIGIVLGTLLLIGIVTGLFMLGHVKSYIDDVIIPQAEEQMTALNVTAYDPSLSSTMYYTDAATGEQVEMMTLFSEENRVWVPYEEMPENLLKATVAIEDKRFFEHHGVDWKRTAAAVVYMFTGRNVQGGSTITQQLIKNISQNDDVTVRRKVLEIFTALEFEKNHEKEEILELYLNYIYLGRRCNGVYTAAHRYFDKEVQDLTLAESACLISITNNPSLYDPVSHPDNNLKRAHTVIMEMYKQGKITEEEELVALAEMGYYPDGKDEKGNTKFTYDPSLVTIQFVNKEAIEAEVGEINSYYEDAVIDQVRDDLMAKYDMSKEAASRLIFTGGLSIYTCFDPAAQASVDAIYQDPANFENYVSRTGQPLLSAVTVVDNATGRVVALGDNRTKDINRGYVLPTDTRRPPGSSIKPLSAYAPALEEGLITPYSAVDDSPFMLIDGKPWPRNSNRTYSGLTSIYESVVHSLNTSAVKTVDLVGTEKSFEYMQKNFGISSLVSYMEGVNGKVYSDIDYAPLALGGLTTGVSTFEMAGAYSVFPRNGIYIPPHLYTKVLDKDGNVVLEYDEAGTPTLSEDTCFYMNNMLEGVVQEGTGTRANISGMRCAGKTGTTTSKYDLWFCGYTPYYTASVWVGYDQSEVIQSSSNPTTTLWKKVMSGLVEGKENKPFPQPQKETVTATYCTKSGDLATSACTLAGCAATGTYLAGDAPTSYCSLHTTLKVCTGEPVAEGETPTYHIAGEFCPEETVKEIGVLDYVRDQAAASASVGDSNQLKSVIEAQGPCQIHTAEWKNNHALMSQQEILLTTPEFHKKVGDAPFGIGAYSVDGAGNPGGALTYTVDNPSVATVESNGTVTIVGEGTAKVVIKAAATAHAPEVSMTVTISVKGSSGGGEGGGILEDLFG